MSAEKAPKGISGDQLRRHEVELEEMQAHQTPSANRRTMNG